MQLSCCCCKLIFTNETLRIIQYLHNKRDCGVVERAQLLQADGLRLTTQLCWILTNTGTVAFRLPELVSCGNLSEMSILLPHSRLNQKHGV